MSARSINVGAFGSVLSVAYRNNSTNTVHVWVAEDMECLSRAVRRLESIKHCEILHSGASLVVGKDECVDFAKSKGE